MIYCTQCGSALNDNSKFCNNCGANIKEQQANSEAPIQEITPTPIQKTAAEHTQAPTASPTAQAYNIYTHSESKDAPAPSIAKAIISIALSGFATIMTGVTSVYSFLFAILRIADQSMGPASFFFTLIMSVYIVPPAIIGLIIGKGYLNSSATRLCGLAKAGKIMGIASLAIICACFLVSLAALA